MDAGDHRRLVEDGVEAWNRWRATAGKLPRLDGALLIELRLAGADLRGADLSGAQLMGSDLAGADLTDARLDGANLMGTRIHGASLAGASLAGADLSGAILDNAAGAPVRLDGANLTRASPRRARLPGGSLAGATLVEADLSDASLLGAYARGADLSRARCSGADLGMIDLSEARLVDADLTAATLASAELFGADLTGARLEGEVLRQARFMTAHLPGADPSGLDLSLSNLSFADLRGATLEGTNLSGAQLVRTDFTRARLHGASVFGTAAWDVVLDGADQRDLRVTRQGQPRVVVDNLEVAQFVHLLLANERVRGVLETVTSKAVLLLGAFGPERKRVLDALREALRVRGWVPILFDFEPAASRDLTETVRILAGLARFVVVDLTDARSVPQEPTSFVPHLAAAYPWVLEPYVYDDLEGLVRELDHAVVHPALERRARGGAEPELRARIAALEQENAALRGRTA